MARGADPRRADVLPPRSDTERGAGPSSTARAQLEKDPVPAQATGAGLAVAPGEVVEWEKKGGDDGVAIWSVTIEVAGDGEVTIDALDDFLAALEPYEPVVIAPPEEPLDGLSRYGADLTIATADAPEAAVYAALIAFREAVVKADLPKWPVVRLELTTEEELEVQLSRPSFPALLGVAEMAKSLAVSKSRASELARSATFPIPVCVLASGPVWLESSVIRYAEGWERRPGRPRSTAVAGPR